MNALQQRKQQLLAEAALHRQLLRLEAARLNVRRTAARDFVARHRWWLATAATSAGVLFARYGSRLLRGSPGLVRPALAVIAKIARARAAKP